MTPEQKQEHDAALLNKFKSKALSIDEKYALYMLKQSFCAVVDTLPYGQPYKALVAISGADGEATRYEIQPFKAVSFARIQNGFSKLWKRDILYARSAKKIQELYAENPSRGFFPQDVNFHFSANVVGIRSVISDYLKENPDFFDDVVKEIKAEAESERLLAVKADMERYGTRRQFGVQSIYRIIRETNTGYYVDTIPDYTYANDGLRYGVIQKKQGMLFVSKSNVYKVDISLEEFFRLKKVTEEYRQDFAAEKSLLDKQIKELREAHERRSVQKDAMYEDDLLAAERGVASL